MAPADDPLPQPSSGSLGSLERDIALIEDMLTAHRQLDHSGVLRQCLKQLLEQCAACRALDNLRQQLLLRWIAEGGGR